MIEERIKHQGPPAGDVLRQHVSRYRFAGTFVRGKRVIDVACGTGYGSAMLAEAGAAHVVGVDVSEASVTIAQGRWKSENVEFLCRDAVTLVEIGPADAVVSFETIEHLLQPEAFLEAVGAVLPGDGRFVVSTPERQNGTLDDRPENPFHVREWNTQEFQGLLSHHFRRVTAFGQYVMAKHPYPGSRTMRRLAAGIIHPEIKDTLYSFPVLEAPPAIRGFRLTCAYIVAVCEDPRRKGSS